MKKISWAAAALLLAALGVIGVGCSTDKGGSDGETVQVGLVQIFMATDTLTFLPGDSAVADGWVVVRDKEGRAMPDVNVDLSLSSTRPGRIEFSDPAMMDCTDVYGKVYFRYRSDNESGYNEIRASVGQVADLWPMWVQPANDVVTRVTIGLDKDQLQTPPGGEDSVMVTVSISDADFNGVAGITLRVTATGGRLAPLPPTDNTGRAVTYWYSAGEFGDFLIKVRAGLLADSAAVHVEELPALRGTLRLAASTDRIAADNCITRAQLRATLKNQYQVGVPNDTIYFAAPHGTVRAMAVTDSNGVAYAEFCEFFSPSVDDSAYVVARYHKWGLADTVRIWIAPASEVGDVMMSLNRTVGIAGVDSAAVTLQVLYQDDTPVSDRFAFLYANCGYFSRPVVRLANGSTDTTVYYRFCPRTTDASFMVNVYAVVEGVSSDTIPITVIPGPARQIDVDTDALEIQVGESMSAWATVRDSLGNALGAGVAVLFETTLGTVAPPMAQTASDGVATTTLSSGTSAGAAMVKATAAGGLLADSTLVMIRSGMASSIQIGVSNPSPQVRETGGEDWTQLMARVYDANGNPVPDGQVVYFQIVADPGGGCDINRRGTVDSSLTSGGLAMATFNAGVTPGPVVIECYTWVLVAEEWIRYSARASNINIVAGPPAEIDIQAGVVGVESNIEDAAWDVPLVALVRDYYNNPVRDSIAVFFDVGENDTASVLSDTVFTGNGMGRPGTAFSTLRYISAATYETIQITGRTAGNDEFPAVSETVSFILPLQEPTINLYAMPATWHFNAPGQGNPCRIECMSVVRDGHGVLINNANVIYSTTRGRFYYNEGGGTEANSRLTGPIGSLDPNFLPGHTSLWLRELALYIFPDDLSPEITGDVQVEVEGYPEAIDSQTINYRRIP